MRRRVSEPEKKVVAARQGWRCSHCHQILQATYQVDHTVALMNGGEDSIHNLTAMCVSCHATKTQWEHIERARQTPSNVDREDRAVGGSTIRCSVCFQRRPASLPWESHHCPGRSKIDLSCFAYTPVNHVIK